MSSTIDLAPKTPNQIDNQKFKLEAKYLPKIKKLFTNIAVDAGALYSLGLLDPTELVGNYKPEFISQLRNIYRDAIEVFGFDVRKSIRPDKDFSPELKERISVEEENLNARLAEANKAFTAAATFFVANESESQVDLLSQTTEEEIRAAIEESEFEFTAEITELTDEQRNLEGQLFLATGAALIALRRKVDKLRNIIDTMNTSRVEFIASYVTKKLKQAVEFRSELIVEHNVGLGESWSREQEISALLSGGIIFGIKKIWKAILDSRTRASHAEADGQVQRVGVPFIVQEESLMRPRDPAGSASNIMRCRCVAIYTN